MVENEPTIYIADKSMKLGRDVCFAILIRKIFDSTWKFTLTNFGTIKMGRNISNILNFSLSELT